MDAAIVVFDGVDEMDVVGPYEVLDSAAKGGAGLRVRLMALPGAAPTVTGQHGIAFAPHGTLADRVDLLVVPGGGWVSRAPRGIRAEIERGDVVRAIADQCARGAVVASVCTGAMALAAAGLLAGRPAVTNHGALDDLRATGALVVRERVVDDGDVVTSGGVTAGIDLGPWLIERFFGRDLAERISHQIEHERRGSVYLGPRAVMSRAR